MKKKQISENINRMNEYEIDITLLNNEDFNQFILECNKPKKQSNKLKEAFNKAKEIGFY